MSALYSTCVSLWSCLSFSVQEASSWVILVRSSEVCARSPNFRSPKSTLGTLMVTMGPYPKSHDEHKEVTNYTQKCHSNNTLMWNNQALCEDFSRDVLVIFLTLKETSTAKLTGSWWCSMWQTRLVTTLSGFPPVTMRSKSKHSFSSGPKPTKDKWINDEPINQLYNL